jgi:hypothetical protein
MVKYFCDRCHAQTNDKKNLKLFVVAAGVGVTARQWTRSYCRDCFDHVQCAVEYLVTETIQTELNGDLFANPHEDQGVDW